MRQVGQNKHFLNDIALIAVSQVVLLDHGLSSVDLGGTQIEALVSLMSTLKKVRI